MTFSWIATAPCQEPAEKYSMETESQISLRKDEAAAGDLVAASRLGAHYASLESPEAWEWYCFAANRGEPWSQVELGYWHWIGIAAATSRDEFLSLIAPDRRIAYMWYNLAASNGNRFAQSQVDTLADRLTAEQLAEAGQMLRDWKPGDCPSAEHRLGMPGDS